MFERHSVKLSIDSQGTNRPEKKKKPVGEKRFISLFQLCPFFYCATLASLLAEQTHSQRASARRNKMRSAYFSPGRRRLLVADQTKYFGRSEGGNSWRYSMGPHGMWASCFLCYFSVLVVVVSSYFCSVQQSRLTAGESKVSDWREAILGGVRVFRVCVGSWIWKLWIPSSF